MNKEIATVEITTESVDALGRKLARIKTGVRAGLAAAPIGRPEPKTQLGGALTPPY